ncbi:MAG: putative aminohydrolase SsnA [Anaerolineae bacterium]|nr:putative aminohydrolase SsnA [Thermoflexales bacterium]MDW8054664.1 putative aminohydrolase SsnA [Anaerolineae bacterium]
MLIYNATMLTLGSHPRVIENGAVLIREGRIADIGESAVLRARHPDERERLDASGKVMLPGGICAHTHFYGAFARGLAIPGEAPRNFIEVLQKLWWRLDRALDYEGVKYSALVCLVDAIKNGMTTLIDHHASPDAIDGALDAIAEAVEQAGVRAALCYEVTDRNGLEGAQRGIAENVRFARRLRQQPSPLLGAAMGIHASFTVSDPTLEACVQAAEEHQLPIHIHVAEDPADEDDCFSKYRMAVVERLAQRGALSARTICAHCIHLSERELDLLAEHGAKVAHQPRSNMNNGVGVARVPEMLARGICVGLGNDGFSNDPFAEMKAADLLQKVSARDPRALGADKVVHMAYTNNAAIAQLFWRDLSGALTIGAAADLVLLDYAPFTPLHAGNAPWHMVFGMHGGMVTHTMVGGRWLMMDRQLLTLDEREIAAKAREAAERAWKKFAALGSD